ncbi:hypothetical protein E4U58_001131 [Claviceps cyperi]|nr:hypothetical protein E4U58_001131 [Claviceps cyperi]
MTLTAQQTATVKSTAPIVKQYGQTITTTFYRNMLNAHPELKNYFSLRNQQLGAQQAALANAVFAYAAYIDDLPKLSNAVERIAQKHASLFIQPEHYPIVGKYLVGAFAEVLGDALTPEITDAWIAAYGQLADAFINREKQLYAKAGDWTTWRKFRISNKEAETDDVVSLNLEPVDGKLLPAFKPGQYVSVQLPIPELGGLLQNRQYSLSVAPDGALMREYRISVKRETVDEAHSSTDDLAAGRVPGVISNRLHQCNVGNEIHISPPCGEFFFDPVTATPDTPVVLLSIGVGAAPLVSILDSILKSSNPTRPITWAQAARHSNSLCFREHIRGVITKSKDVGNLRRAVFVKNIAETDKKGIDYDYEGPLSLATLADDEALFLDNEATEYYICGPEDWMVQMRDQLVDREVPLERMHLELFRIGDV